jgi:hypothetical protein
MSTLLTKTIATLNGQFGSFLFGLLAATHRTVVIGGNGAVTA